MVTPQLPPIQTLTLLQQALTHRSFAHEHPQEGGDNERLEFLGDAVLNYLIAEFLFKRYPTQTEADLTRIRAAVVDATHLAHLAQQLGVGSRMRLGKGVDQTGGRENLSLLSNTFEALIGAYVLDSGIEAVRLYVEDLFSPVIESILVQQTTAPHKQLLVDPKGYLQQWSLATFGEIPQYFLLEATGPDHAKQFTVGVRIHQTMYGIGNGRRQKEAEKQAAEAALKELGLEM